MSEPTLLSTLSTPGAMAAGIVWTHFRLNNVERRLDSLATHLGAPVLSKKRSRIRAALFLALVATAALCFTGCAYVSVRDNERKASVSCVTPAWPWQDSTRVLDRLSVSARSNTFTTTIRGLDESQTTSTNAVDLVGRVTGAAVSAAIGAAR